MEVVLSTTEGTLGYILNHRQKRAIQSSHVHRSRLSHQVSLGWCRVSLCDPPHHEGLFHSLFPQCVYTGPGEGKFGCWKWSYITIQVMALGTGHPRRHSQENGPSAWIHIYGKGARVTPGASPDHPCCKRVTLEARLTTRMPGSLFTSWRRFSGVLTVTRSKRKACDNSRSQYI